MTRWKLWTGTAVVSVLLLFLGLEVTARLWLADRIHSPAVLRYPFHDMFRVFPSILPDHVVDGYAKYRPDPEKPVFVVGPPKFERANVHINRRGFRGPEVAVPKPEGTIRIVCLGESSTFGAFNRDHETYPHFLSEILAEELPGKTIEVVNLGVSELTSNWLEPMLEREILPLEPDWVTFYGGHNDIRNYIGSGWALPDGHRSEFERSNQDPKSYSIFWNVVKLYFFVAPEFRDRTRDAFAVVAPRLEANLLRLADAVEARGGKFLVVTQRIRPRATYLRDLTYEEAYQRLREEDLSEWWTAFAKRRAFAHYPLMRALPSMAGGRFEVLDGIGALDEAEGLFVSHVHLTAKGNARLARLIADRLKKGIE